MTANAGTVSFRTVGCRTNQAETALLASQFEAAGYRVVPFGTACDVTVIHSCAVTHRAQRDSARLARGARNSSPSGVVVVAGCAAEIDPETLREESGADMLVPQADKFRLPQLLGHAAPSDDLVPRFETTRALLKVQDGCEFGCAYCVVPRARGAQRSVPFDRVIDQLARLVDQGYREVVLTGANLGTYSDGAHTLVNILERAEAMPGLERVRLSSIEITTVERAVIDFMAGSQKLCRYLHLPLQSGSARVLSAMGRKYGPREYEALVQYAADRLAVFGLGTDVMVGFPGEDREAFEETLELVSALPFTNLHVFPYSVRPETRAAALDGQVEESEKTRRTRELLDLGQVKKASFAASFVGKPVSVLVEKLDENGRGTGWTGEYVRAVTPPAAINDIVEYVPIGIEDDALVLSYRTESDAVEPVRRR
ncbi:MAG: MiaB/RimO family radical SAM methylthiotransferase [Lentisphaerae bacterium]|nr:MiaB/RimO family radical SAM methylthiotransferase [Lentisphaerota bacterium]